MRFLPSFYIAPLIIWSLAFIVFPLMLTINDSFHSSVDSHLTLDNYKEILTSPTHIHILWHSLKMVIQSSIILVFLGYIIAYSLNSLPKTKRYISLLILVFPMWLNSMVRVYSWISILSKKGIIPYIIKQITLFLNHLGFSIPIFHQSLLFHNGTVLLGLVYNNLPFIIIPIFLALQAIPRDSIEAAGDLGANNWQTFTKIIFPASLAGIISGLLITSLNTLTTFYISSLLGGNKVILLGNIIENQYLHADNPELGASMSVIALLFTLLTLLAISLLLPRSIRKESFRFI